MKIVRFLAVMLSSLLLGAHFLRGGHMIVVALCLALPLLLFVKQRWAAVALRAVLFLGALEWIRTAALLTRDRLVMGESWIRMAVILAVVSLTTLTAALLVRPPHTTG